MTINYNQISFSGLATAFLALGFLQSILTYRNQIRKRRKSVKKPKQIELWIASYSSFTSVVTFVGFATETYYYGARLIMNLVAITIGYIVAFAILQPFFYDVDVKSPYEYLEKRYANRLSIRVISTFFGMVFRFSFATLFLWANATVLVTLFPECELYIAMIVIGCLSAIYALLGGLVQTMYVNLIQVLIFFIGTLCALSVAITLPSDKLTYYWNLASQNNRLKFIETSGDITVRYTVWNQLFSQSIPWCCFHAILTPHILRYKLIKSKNISSLYMISHLPIMFIVNAAAVFCGIFIYITFHDCDPYLSQKIINKNQIATYFLITVLDEKLPSVAGFSLAVLFAYGIMQHAFGLHFSAHLFITDILKPLYAIKNKEEIDEKKINIIKSIIVLVLAVISVFYGFSFQYVKNSVMSLFFLMNTSINAPMAALVFLSMFNPYANHVGALSTFVISIAVNIWAAFGVVTQAIANPKSQEFVQSTSGCSNSTVLSYINTNSTYTPDNQALFTLYSVSHIWYSLFNFIFIIVFGSLISLIYSLIAKRRVDLDEEYKEERKKYLFYFKKNFAFADLCKKKSKSESSDNTSNVITDDGFTANHISENKVSLDHVDMDINIDTTRL